MIKWESCIYWPGEVYFEEAGIILRAGVGHKGQWFGIAATTNTWFDHCSVMNSECRRGPPRRTIEAAKKDAVRLGKELVQDILVSSAKMARAFDVEVE